MKHEIYIEIKHRDLYIFPSDQPEQEEGVEQPPAEELLESIPTYIYRQPMHNAMAL